MVNCHKLQLLLKSDLVQLPVTLVFMSVHWRNSRVRLLGTFSFSFEDNFARNVWYICTHLGCDLSGTEQPEELRELFNWVDTELLRYFSFHSSFYDESNLPNSNHHY
eukprot:TRINITY_DN895_c0_g1_i10.p1 TRINITY_DN895_c0_g1~~TRINITY_DN895_c0_g1_i10.p1  ORF type:complete len:107 (+),score=9.97 TRINITY_DN895_c0_g1_i10:491-811(+)